MKEGLQGLTKTPADLAATEGARTLFRIRTGRVGLAALAALFVMALYGSPATATSFSFSTGNPDGKMAMATRPDSSGKPEIEAADDFVLGAQTAITHATFTGIVPASGSVQVVNLEIYRVFPLDSSTTRTPRVPTRVNSPSDVDFQERSTSTRGQLSLDQSSINSSFTAQNSVLNGIHPLPNQTTGGEGPVSGREISFAITLNDPFVLPAGHYFFVPQVQVSGSASNFYWLSAPRPILSPGTPFTPDLQAWIRNSALDPDWLRVGTDIVGGATPPTFNAAFTLNNAPLPVSSSSQGLSGRVGVRLTVKVPGGGKAQALDPLAGRRGHKQAWFNTVTARISHSGIVHLTVVPNSTGRKHLSSKRKTHVRVQVIVTPTGGRPSTRTITIAWK
jgi:hypothetical protein